MSVALHPDAAAPSPALPAEGPMYGVTEERILSAALGLIGRRGVKRLGMQEVSEAAGVSRGTLYRYFPNRDRLLDGVAGYDEANFTRGLAAALAPVHEPAERLGASHSITSACTRLARCFHPNLSSFWGTSSRICRSCATHCCRNWETPSTPFPPWRQDSSAGDSWRMSLCVCSYRA
jgi:AcrR family transcriptional regulator